MTSVIFLPLWHHNSPNQIGTDVNHFQFSEIFEILLTLEDFDAKKSFGIDKVYPFLLRSAILQVC